MGCVSNILSSNCFLNKITYIRIFFNLMDFDGFCPQKLKNRQTFLPYVNLIFLIQMDAILLHQTCYDKSITLKELLQNVILLHFCNILNIT